MSGHAEFRGQVREARQALHSLFGTGQPEPELPELLPLPVTGPGFYDMTMTEYIADPCPAPSLSSGLAHALVTKTPAHARLEHARLRTVEDEDESEYCDIGTLAHAAFLEGRDVVQVLNYPDWRTKAAREARAAVRATGRIPLLRKTWAEVEAMLAATRPWLDVHADGAAMFRDGLAEATMIWQEDGLWFRSRIDWLRLSLHRRQFAIDDYKTTGKSANPEQLGNRTFYDNGWDMQASFYRRGLHALTGYGAEFRFAVQETYAPYALSVIAPSGSFELLGDMRVAEAIDRWSRAMKRDEWPGYARQTAYVEVPGWLEKQWADREGSDAD